MYRLCPFPKLMLLALIISGFLSSCSSTYYHAMEKVGVHKRDIMVNRVEDARNAQQTAQQQFSSALEQFASVITLKETDLKKAYDRLNREYEQCVSAAATVSNRIDRIETVAEDLFKEWRKEITLYENREFARSSQRQLDATIVRYRDMMARMKQAEGSMEPVLTIFRDNVLFLKHNLNAQAIGSLQYEFAGLKAEINTLISRMNEAIASSNEFIAGMQQEN